MRINSSLGKILDGLLAPNILTLCKWCTHPAMTLISSLSGVLWWSQFIKTLAVPSTAAKCIEAYCPPIHCSEVVSRALSTSGNVFAMAHLVWSTTPDHVVLRLALGQWLASVVIGQPSLGLERVWLGVDGLVVQRIPEDGDQH